MGGSHTVAYIRLTWQGLLKQVSPASELSRAGAGLEVMLRLPVKGHTLGTTILEYTELNFSCCLRGHLPYRGILKLGMLVFSNNFRSVLPPVFLVSVKLFMLSLVLPSVSPP